MRRALTNIALASLIFAGGYYCGKNSEKNPNPSNLPIAQGFLDVPNAYTINERINQHNEREIYLQDTNRNVEWPLIEKSIPLIESYMGNGKYIMEGAMTTVKTSRKMLSFGGVDTYNPQQIRE